MLTNKSLSIESVEIGEEIAINIFRAQKDPVIKVDGTAFTIRRAIGLHQEAIGDKEDNKQDDSNGEEYRVGNRQEDVGDEEFVEDTYAV